MKKNIIIITSVPNVYVQQVFLSHNLRYLVSLFQIFFFWVLLLPPFFQQSAPAKQSVLSHDIRTKLNPAKVSDLDRIEQFMINASYPYRIQNITFNIHTQRSRHTNIDKNACVVCNIICHFVLNERKITSFELFYSRCLAF